MYRALLLFSISVTFISLTSSYVPVKGGRHSIKPKEESTTKAIDHHETKHDEVIYPIIIENKDLTPKDTDNDKVTFELNNQDGSQTDNSFKSVLEDTNKTAIQENNHKSTSFNNNRQEEIEINQSKNDSSVSHSEDHHMKNKHEEQHIYKEIKENFHREQVTTRNQVVYNNGVNFDHNKHKNHAVNDHKISINEDQHKVSMSNLDGKNVEHKHNEHSLHVSNIDNPSNYHIEQHTSFDGVKIDGQQNVARDHHSEKVDIEVPFLTGSLDVQGKVDSNSNVFQETGHHIIGGITLDNFDKNLNVGVHDSANKKYNGVFQDKVSNNGFEENKGISNKHKHHDDKILNAHTNQHSNAHSEFNSHDQKHAVFTKEENQAIFNINKDLKDTKNVEETRHSSSNKDKTLLDSVVGGTVTGGSNQDSIDKKINHKPGPSIHHGAEPHHHIPFAHEHHSSFEKHDFEHHHPMFEGHHHEHHFYPSHSGFNLNDQKHAVFTEEENHSYGGKASFNINKDLKDTKNIEETRHSSSNTDKTLLESVVGGTVTFGSNQDSIDKKINHKPRPSIHHGAEPHHHIPFDHEHHSSFEKHDFEHHHPMFEGHHHEHHFYPSHGGFNLNDQKHAVFTEEENHSYGGKASFNINKDLKDTKNVEDARHSSSNTDKTLLESVVGGTVTFGSNQDSIDKKINHKPGPSFHHGAEPHHPIPFAHKHHGSSEKHDFEGHHHDDHFFHLHEFDDSSEECSDEHGKFDHRSPYYHHHHHAHHHPGPHDFSDLQHSKHHIKIGHIHHR